MKHVVLMIAGAAIAGITFAAWWIFNLFACGMKPMGCGNFSLQWGDWEALRLFVPTFVAGVALFLFGAWGRYRANG